MIRKAKNSKSAQQTWDTHGANTRNGKHWFTMHDTGRWMERWRPTHIHAHKKRTKLEHGCNIVVAALEMNVIQVVL